MNRRQYDLIEKYMLQCMKDAAHDREHVYRVLHNAVEIAQDSPEVDWDVLIAAALLHDISRTEQMADPRIDHALHGADKAYGFLMSQGFSTVFCDHVRQCIRTHRFRKSEPPVTLEAKILFDADKLDVSGAIGIARTLEYNGAASRSIYSRDADGTILDGSKDTEDSFFREYKFKLENIYGYFLTEKGRTLAAARQNAAKAFYEALLREVRGGEGGSILKRIVKDE